MDAPSCPPTEKVDTVGVHGIVPPAAAGFADPVVVALDDADAVGEVAGAETVAVTVDVLTGELGSDALGEPESDALLVHAARASAAAVKDANTFKRDMDGPPRTGDR